MYDWADRLNSAIVSQKNFDKHSFWPWFLNDPGSIWYTAHAVPRNCQSPFKIKCLPLLYSIGFNCPSCRYSVRKDVDPSHQASSGSPWSPLPPHIRLCCSSESLSIVLFSVYVRNDSIITAKVTTLNII